MYKEQKKSSLQMFNWQGNFYQNIGNSNDLHMCDYINQLISELLLRNKCEIKI